MEQLRASKTELISNKEKFIPKDGQWGAFGSKGEALLGSMGSNKDSEIMKKMGVYAKDEINFHNSDIWLNVERERGLVFIGRQVRTSLGKRVAEKVGYGETRVESVMFLAGVNMDEIKKRGLFNIVRDSMEFVNSKAKGEGVSASSLQLDVEKKRDYDPKLVRAIVDLIKEGEKIELSYDKRGETGKEQLIDALFFADMVYSEMDARKWSGSTKIQIGEHRQVKADMSFWRCDYPIKLEDLINKESIEKRKKELDEVTVDKYNYETLIKGKFLLSKLSNSIYGLPDLYPGDQTSEAMVLRGKQSRHPVKQEEKGDSRVIRSIRRFLSKF